MLSLNPVTRPNDIYDVPDLIRNFFFDSFNFNQKKPLETV